VIKGTSREEQYFFLFASWLSWDGFSWKLFSVTLHTFAKHIVSLWTVNN
jgi:hypothetical protein